MLDRGFLLPLLEVNVLTEGNKRTYKRFSPHGSLGCRPPVSNFLLTPQPFTVFAGLSLRMVQALRTGQRIVNGMSDSV